MAVKKKKGGDESTRPGSISDIYILLVGIDTYQTISGLNGCIKDLNRIETFLKKFWGIDPDATGTSKNDLVDYTNYNIPLEGYGLLKIANLKNEQASRQGIINGFQSFLKDAGPDDSIWFHFSGHGSEAPSALELQQAGGPEKDQGLMCWDYEFSESEQYHGFLADKELALLLEEVSSVDNNNERWRTHILVSLDCCHAGGGTRDRPIRNIAVEDEEPRPLSTYYRGEDLIEDQQLKVPQASHIVLSACTHLEVAGENSNGGYFTNALIDALETTAGGFGEISYSDLLIRTRAAVRNKKQEQTPQFDVLGGQKAYTLFLQGFPYGDPERYEIKFPAGSKPPTIAVGAIHGLPISNKMLQVSTAGNNPVKVDIYGYQIVETTVTDGRSQEESDGEGTDGTNGSGGIALPNGEYSTMEFKRSDFGIKLHMIDFDQDDEANHIEGAWVRQISDEYSALEFRRAGFGIQMEIFDAENGEPKIKYIDGENGQTEDSSNSGSGEGGIKKVLRLESSKLGEATISAVGPFYSNLEITSEGWENWDVAGKNFYGVLNVLPADPELVLLSGETEEVQAFLEAGERFTRIGAKNIQLISEVDSMVQYELRVDILSESISITDLRTEMLVEKTYEKDDPEEVLDDLIRIVNWRRLIAFQGPEEDPSLRDRISFQVQIGNSTIDSKELTEPYVRLVASEDGQIDDTSDPQKRYYRIIPSLEVEREDEEELFFYLFSLYSDYTIALLPDETQDTNTITFGDHQSWGLEAEEDRDTLYFKLIVSKEEIDAHQFIQDGIGDGDRNPSPKPDQSSGFDEWAVITIELEMVREGVDGRGGGSGNGTGSGQIIELGNTAPVARHTSLKFRRSHAIVIGINEYPLLRANLRTAASDAEEVAKRLKGLQSFDNVLLMQDVSKEQIELLLEWLKQPTTLSTPSIPNEILSHNGKTYPSKVGWLMLEEELGPNRMHVQDVLTLTTEEGNGPSKQRKLYLMDASQPYTEPTGQPFLAADDSIVFYYAGHGIPGEVGEGPAGYLAPADASNDLVNNSSLLSMDDVYQALSKGIECRHTLLVLDCCFAGKFKFSSLTRGRIKPFLLPIHERRFKHYQENKAWQVLVSAGENQTAADSAAWADIRSHSPFAQTFIQALEGKADIPSFGNRGKRQGDGLLTANEIFLYVWDRVEHIQSEVKPQHPDLFPMAQHEEGEFIFLNPRVQGALEFADDPDKNPYLGLKPYQQEHATFFFGQDEAIRDVLKKLTSTDLLFISGASGSGKTSLVQAGIFPRLEEIKHFYTIRPGELTRTPSESTNDETAASSIGEASPSATEDATAPPNITDLETIEAGLNAGHGCAILLDQFEEIFSLPNPAANLLLVQDLIGAVARANGKAKLFFTYRSDYEWKIKANLGEYCEKQSMFRMPEMNLDQLREIITGPAWWAMYDFQDNAEATENDTGEVLINEILEDISYAPGALPLLSFMMHNFYFIAQEKGRKFILDDYRAFQGIEGAISRIADQTYNEITGTEGDLQVAPPYLFQLSPEQRMFRQLLLRMVSVQDGVLARRRVYYAVSEKAVDQQGLPILNELDFPEQDEMVDELIHQLAEANLVEIGTDEFGASYAEPAHDALITHWDRCRKWLDEFCKEPLNLQRRVWQAVLDLETEQNQNVFLAPSTKDDTEDLAANVAHTWELNPKLDELTKAILDPQDHWIDPQFSAYLEDMAPLLWGEDLSPEQVSKLEALQRPQEQNHPLVRRILFGPTPTGDVLLPGGVQLESLSIVQAIQLAMDNWLNAREKEFVKDSWRRRVGRIKQLTDERNQAVANELAANALASSNRKTAFRLAELAQAIDPGNMRVKEQLLRNYYFSEEPPHYSVKTTKHQNTDLAISSDGTIIATASTDREIRLWNLETGTFLGILGGHDGPSEERHSGSVQAVAFWGNEKMRLASGSHDGTVRIWEEEDGSWSSKHTLDHLGKGIDSIAVSPNGAYIAAGGRTGKVVIWSGTKVLAGQNPDPFYSRTFYPDSEETVTITSLDFSPNSQQLVMGTTRFSEDRDAIVEVWQLNGEDDPVRISNTSSHEDELRMYTTVFLSDQYVLSGSRDRSLKRWKIEGTIIEDDQLILDINERSDFSIICGAVSPNLEYMAVVVDKLYIYLFDPQTKNRKYILHEIPLDGGRIGKLVFSPDGKHLAGIMEGQLNVWNMAYRKDEELSPPAKGYFERGAQRLTERSDRNLAYTTDGNFSIEAGPEPHPNDPSDHPDVIQRKTIRLIDHRQGSESTIEILNEVGVQFLLFFPDNQHFLSGHENGEIKIWDRTSVATDTTPIQTLATGERPVRHVAMSQDGTLLIVCKSEDPLLEVWKQGTGGFSRETGERFTFQHRMRYNDCRFVQLSPDDTEVLLGGSSALKVYPFSATTGFGSSARLNILGGFHYGHFSADGQLIFTYSAGSLVRVWEAETGILKITQEYKQGNWGMLAEEESKWVLIARRHPNTPRAVWFDSTKLVEAANQDPWMGALTPEEITTYQLELYFDLAGYIDAEGSPAPIIQQGNEDVIFNLGLYYLQKGLQSERHEIKMDARQKAEALFLAGKQIGQLYKSATYDDYLRDVQRLS